MEATVTEQLGGLLILALACALGAGFYWLKHRK